jgi:hypothetical protein
MTSTPNRKANNILNHSSQLSRLSSFSNKRSNVHAVIKSATTDATPAKGALQRERTQQQAHSLVPQQRAFFSFPGQQPQQPIQPPLTLDMNPTLEQLVLAIQREYTPDNSNDIYDNKTKEYFQFCDYCYPPDNYNKVLEANKAPYAAVDK